MKNFNLIIYMIGLMLIVSGLAKADIPVVWQTDLSHESQNSIQRIKLTPHNETLIVFGSSGNHGVPILIDKLAVTDGNLVWDPPKEVTKSGKRLEGGWVDRQGNIYIGSVWGGYTLWKYDPNLENELCSYTGSTGFEYVQNIKTDDSNNIYAAGHIGSWWGAPSTVVKIDDCCNKVWDSTIGPFSSGKDRYTHGLALDSNNNVFHVGCDDLLGFRTTCQGRLIGHRASDGEVFLNILVDETNSAAYGVITDPCDNIYIGYSYNLWTEPYTRTLEEHSVIQKQDHEDPNTTIWRYVFDDIGMYTVHD